MKLDVDSAKPIFEGVEVDGVGTCFGLNTRVVNWESSLHQTGFLAPQLVYQFMAELAWKLGTEEGDRFRGHIILRSFGPPDEEEFGLERSSRAEFSEGPLEWTREGEFLVVHPVDLADVRRFLYPATRSYSVEVSSLDGDLRFGMTQSCYGISIDRVSHRIHAQADRVASALGARISWGSKLIVQLTESIERLDQFDFP